MAHNPGWVIRRLSELPKARLSASSPGSVVPFQVAEGPEIGLSVVSKLNLSSRALVALAKSVDVNGDHRAELWAVEKLSAVQRRELAAAGISWIERKTGFLHLDQPPYYVHDLGMPAGDDYSLVSKAGGSRPTLLIGLSGRCAETLILWAEAQRKASDGGVSPEMTSALLAELSGVSLPLANKVLNRLGREGVLEPLQKKQRVFSWSIPDPFRVLDLWADEDSRAPSTTGAYVWALSSHDLLKRLIEIDAITKNWALGGLAAANLYAPILTVDPQPEVWIPDALSVAEVVGALGGSIVKEGANINFRQMARDSWMQHSTRIGSAGSANCERQSSSTELPLTRAVLPVQSELDGLRIISWPRAYVETSGIQGGRSADVAQAILENVSSI